MVKYIYIVFLGLILALFVGLGINTFYESPKEPTFPLSSEKEDSEQTRAAQLSYESEYRHYNEDQLQPYNRNVAIIALVASVLLLIVGVLLERRNDVIGNGIVLGGLFTLLYNIVRSVASNDTKLMFAVVTIALAAALYLGYKNYSAHHSHESERKTV